MNDVQLTTTQQTTCAKPKSTKKIKYAVKSDFPYKAKAIFGLKDKQEAKK